MLSLFSKVENLVGLDIGSHCVKLMQVNTGNVKPRLLSMGIAPLPRETFVEGRVAKPEVVADSIRQLATHLKVKQKSGCDLHIRLRRNDQKDRAPHYDRG